MIDGIFTDIHVLCFIKITDEWTVKVSEVLNLLQKRIEEERDSRKFETQDLSRIVEGLQKQFQVISPRRPFVD